MTNLEQAKIVKNAFSMLINETTLKARNGDKKAALNLMDQMTAESIVLKSLGYAVSSGGRLIQYKPLSQAKQRIVDLTLRSAHGDCKAAEELLKIYSKGL